MLMGRKRSVQWFSRLMFVFKGSLTAVHSIGEHTLFDFCHLIRLYFIYFTWSIVAEDFGQLCATFLFLFGSHECKGDGRKSATFIHVYQCILDKWYFSNDEKGIHISSQLPSATRLAVAPVDEAGDEETKQLLEGDDSLLDMWWKVGLLRCNNGNFPILKCLEGLWLFLWLYYYWLFYLWTFASWGWLKIDKHDCIMRINYMKTIKLELRSQNRHQGRSSDTKKPVAAFTTSVLGFLSQQLCWYV